MTATTEQEILDRLYASLGQARACATDMQNPIRLRMLLATTDYERLYDAMELAEGCCRQMCAWREDYRWNDVAYTIGLLIVKLKEWVTPDALPLFEALVRFLDRTEAVCITLQHQATGILGAILPERTGMPMGAGESLH